MSKQEKAHVKDKIKTSSTITILGDLVFLLVFAVCLLFYSNQNTQTTFQQNIDNLTSLAESNSRLMETVFNNIDNDVLKASKYCNGKTLEETLAYLEQIANQNEEYQLLKQVEESTDAYPKYWGFSSKRTNGEFTPLLYEDTALSDSLFLFSNPESGEVSYTQSFTNQTDGFRYFASFCGVSIQDNGDSVQYYIVKPIKEGTILDNAQRSPQYSNLSMAFCYTDGKYLAQDSSFRGDNFYNYIYSFNDLTLDEKNALRDSVLADEDGIGYFRYKDFRKQDCVYSYATSGKAENWLFIVSVPETDFVQTRLFSTFPSIIIIFLAILLFFNIYRLLIIVKQLRLSLKRELIANKSKSSFLSRMSHEIRTPLNAIIGYNILARNEIKDVKTEEERRQAEMKVLSCLEKNEIASKHLLSVINDVLDISAIERGKVQITHDRFNLKGLIHSLTTVFYSQATAKGVNFNVRLNNLTEEWFIGDQVRTSQILTNLLSNAMKFTPENGNVTLVVSQLEEKEKSHHLRFEVSDTGIGMSQEYLKRIWEAFEQADSSISRRFGGSGLGLSIVKNLIDLMGGTITVTSKQGEGSTFVVDLFLDKTNQPETSAPYDFSQINALVVDDDQSTCDYISLLFNRCGARCVTTTSGQGAIKAVSDSIESKKPFTICLVDWKMPYMDGIETIKRIREIAGNDLMILVLSAYDYTEIEDQAAKVGITQFISKPIFQSTLFDLLLNISGKAKPKEFKESKEFDFTGSRILLAEDNEMNMEIAKNILESVNVVVDSAWNGEEAVQMFQNAEPGKYSLILMDIHMPKMNGNDATKAIRASAHPDAMSIPIIAMTADAFAENVAQSREAGMNDHISKPIEIQAFFSTLKTYLK